jgi:demethylmenaquinone methyltransferase/2-methoxy-6-polyprenyl-1,4-benzoquinol methylase
MTDEYDATAKYYDPLLYFALRHIRQEIIRLIPQKNLAILDLCCGTGDQLKKLAREGFSNLTGVDQSFQMLRQARKGNTHARLIQGDARHTGLPEAHFDILIICFAIHEKSPQDQDSMLDEAHRLLAPGGQVIFADFSLDSQATAMGKIGVTLVERLAGGEHYRNFNAYVNQGGLPLLIQDRFQIRRQIRHAFGAVSIWMATPKKGASPKKQPWQTKPWTG